MSKEISYTIHDGFDHIIEESGNVFIALRKLSWGDRSDCKLDLRKWYSNASGEETVGKGVSFMTEEGPHELTRVLLEEGYGHTAEVLDAIKDREDFGTALRSLDDGVLLTPDDENATEYYDPKELIL